MIARAIYRRRIIETWGRGTLKIARLTREAGQGPPTVSLRPCAAVLTFGFAAATATGTPGTLLGDAGKATGITTGTTPVAVLRLLAGDPNLSVPQVAARLKKSELTIHRAIRTLRESGRLTRVGPG
jgi:ATP-dependent DNA helicase RecG